MENIMPKRTKKVPYLQTAEAEVQVHIRGKRLELIVSLPADISWQLAKRLPKRFKKK
jgi:hypothetical protein